MRPDPYKQKASRRHQAAHRPTQSPQNATQDGKASTTSTISTVGPPRERSKYARRKIQDNSWRFNDDPANTSGIPTESGGAAEADDDENVRDFLDYLKEESQNIYADQSAAYFRLRSEAESANLSSYNEDTWSKLVEINWDGLLRVAAAMPLHELLGVKDDTPLPEEMTSMLSEEPERKVHQSRQINLEPQIAGHVAGHIPNALELAPGISPNKGTPTARTGPAAASVTHADGVSALPAKSNPSVDDLEAFLDQIL
ncbi:hypothetical protein COEREDRAFT_91685 [Coemansia reversa NRRL 1564]|uniref:Uncharacterized protein n=1 Tax=Coemansia reversa (strain ATCC 12441 / NRRL 1564) TaxID=763665 RepID=A0A2G5BEZ9_COERN|nr:hypothetical protein COEREDRAFT_91685 [Coemansia reversa NRRL 1564]|eukprot:PIA17606.1 hypothetical protein COEREDRAFT_91685 [Coemansia reversa NRRL 1564]